MIEIDPRVLWLIIILNEQGLGWMVPELIEGIQRGRESLEKEFGMESERQQTWEYDRDLFFREMEEAPPKAPLQGDDQFYWVTEYIYERIDATLEELSASLGALDKIVFFRDDLRTGTGETSVVLSFVDAEDERQIGRAEVKNAQNQLSNLRMLFDSRRYNFAFLTMTNEVESALEQIVGSVGILQKRDKIGGVFELYIMTGIGLALKNRGCDVWIQQSDGQFVRPTGRKWTFFHSGGSPSRIKSKTRGPNNASSIVFLTHNCTTWELLNGIRFYGRSTALHEIDIAIIPHSVANSLRNLRDGGYPVGRPRVSIECKDIPNSGGIGEMRIFTAILYDLTLLHSHHRSAELSQLINRYALSEPTRRPTSRYGVENRRTLNVFARKGGFSREAKRLADYYEVKQHGGIEVGSLNSKQLMDEVTNWICKNCQ